MDLQIFEYEGEKYRYVDIDQLLGMAKLPFDVFLQFSSGKLFKLSRRGHPVSRDQLESYQGKRVERLAVRIADYKKFLKEIDRRAEAVVHSADMSDEAKYSVLGYLASKIFSDLGEYGFNRDTLMYSQAIVSRNIRVMEESRNPAISNILQSFESLGDPFMAHAMGCSAITVLIGKGLEWTSARNLENLALAGLIHDIGQKLISEEARVTAVRDMSPDILMEYQRHPELGYHMVKGLKEEISEEVCQAILQHHEFQGLGFPRSVREAEVHPFAKMVALADEFVHLTMGSPHYPTLMKPREAMRNIELTGRKRFRTDDINALKKALTNKL